MRERIPPPAPYNSRTTISLNLEAIEHSFRYGMVLTKDAVGSLLVPILTPSQLTTLCIILLCAERLARSIIIEPQIILLNHHHHNFSKTSTRRSMSMISKERDEERMAGAALHGSSLLPPPAILIGLSGLGILLVSCCIVYYYVSNNTHPTNNHQTMRTRRRRSMVAGWNSSFLLRRRRRRTSSSAAPHEQETAEEHPYQQQFDQSTILLYTLLGLFCLESLLAVWIILLLVFHHAMILPEQEHNDFHDNIMMETHQQLGLLLGMWVGSLLGSHVLRKHFYQCMGDWLSFEWMNEFDDQEPLSLEVVVVDMLWWIELIILQIITPAPTKPSM